MLRQTPLPNSLPCRQLRRRNRPRQTAEVPPLILRLRLNGTP